MSDCHDFESESTIKPFCISEDFYHKHLYQLCYLLQLKVANTINGVPFDDSQFKSNFIRLYK